MHDSLPDLALVEDTYERGRYLDAFHLLEEIGGVTGQRDVPGLLIAGRIASNLGALRRGRLLVLRAHRSDPGNPRTAFYYSSALADVLGPLPALRFLDGFVIPPAADAETRALLLLSRAVLLATVRDFEAAESLAEEASRIWEHAWLWVERSIIAVRADRMADAQLAAEKALACDPSYRPALMNMANLLALQDRRVDAEHLLATHADSLQSPYLLLQLAQIRHELDRPAEALDAVVKAVGIMPLPELDVIRGLAGLASNLHFKCNDLETAASLARMTGAPVYRRLAERLEAAPPPRRVLLGVPFVRQDHKTCAPATLTSLCRFHLRPAEHVAIVEEICYDGTPAANERRWAEQNGFFAQHFTVTWDAATALLDRGLPFALLTVAPDSAHLQAVAGYDHRRRSLLIRDPSVPDLVEIDADELFTQQKFSGPQGLVLAPPERAAEIAQLQLPDWASHDALYRLQQALLQHDRAGAATQLDLLLARDPDGVVTAKAQRAVAAYDNNSAEALRAAERLLIAAPDAPTPLVDKLSCLGALGREDERRQQLLAVVDRQGTDPIFTKMWSQDLAGDARTADMAQLLLVFLARQRPHDGQIFALLAQIAYLRGQMTEACRLQRFAACVDDMNEWASEQYFRLARATGQREAGLRFLRSRVARLGRRSALPWQTLYHALRSLDRAEEAATALNEALVARPDDGAMALFAASAALREGQLSRSQALLAAARGRVKETDWLLAAAQTDRAAGVRDAALERLAAVLRLEPLSVEAHAATAHLLLETAGRDAARTHLLGAATQHPHHARLARLLVDFTPDEGEEGVRVVRQVVALAPTDAWARRELALRLARRQRPEEAAAEAEQAALLEPDAAATHGIRGAVLAAAGQRDGAREAFRQALRRSADYVFAFNGLLDLADDLADRLRAIRWLQQELRRQVVFGDGLAVFRTSARGLLPDEEIVSFLEEARQARPDLLGCWTSVVEQRLAMGDLEGARGTAANAVAQFPLVTDPLIALYSVHERRGDREAQRAALHRCLELEPDHAFATRSLARVMAAGGDADGAIALLRRAVERTPLDIGHHGALAQQLEENGQLPAAFDALGHLLQLDPSVDWGWEHLLDWGERHAARAEALAVAEAVVLARPHSGDAHLGRARVLLMSPGRLQDALAGIDEALAREPRLMDAHEMRAVLLAQLSRFDEALAACRPAVFGETPPASLRGRRAWILAQQRQMERAIEEMEQLVGDRPDYLFGWSRLGDWYEGRNDLGNARRCYERLLLLQPTRQDAIFGLFDVCLAQRDLQGCDAALERLDRRDESAFVLARRIQLLCAQGRTAEALPLFRTLVHSPLPQVSPALAAIKALAGRGRQRAALREVETALVAESAPSDHLGEAWGHAVSEIGLLRLLPRIRKLLRGGSAAKVAVATIVEVLGDQRRGGLLFILRCLFRNVFRRSVRIWGSMGYALVTVGHHRWTIRWMHDYRGYDDAKPWMLNNLALAFRELGRDDEAAAVSRLALTKPADHTTDIHRLWLAWDAAVLGMTPEAIALLGPGVTTDWDLGVLLQGYTRAVLDVATAGGPVAGAQVSLEAHARIAAAESAHPGTAQSRLGRRLAATVRSRLG